MSVASTVTERAFAERRRADWDRLDALVKRAVAVSVKKLPIDDVLALSPLYQSVCADLAAAEAARYSAPLVDYLRGLTTAAHLVIYGTHAHEASPNGKRSRSLRHAWLVAFPRTVRRFRREMLLAAALFFLPLGCGVLGSMHDPTFAFRIVPEAMLRQLSAAYSQGFSSGRSVGEGTLMVGYYVNNNVGIALRCFALGLFAGVGSAFYLVYNGLSIGAILGYVASQGAGKNVLVFILGHGSLELGAIVLAGGAGLSLGWSFVAPRELSRIHSLQTRAKEILVTVIGASIMLTMAAAIEGFWSASSAPDSVKLAVGGVLLVLVLAYLLLAGRDAPEHQGTAQP